MKTPRSYLQPAPLRTILPLVAERIVRACRTIPHVFLTEVNVHSELDHTSSSPVYLVPHQHGPQSRRLLSFCPAAHQTCELAVLCCNVLCCAANAASSLHFTSPIPAGNDAKGEALIITGKYAHLPCHLRCDSMLPGASRACMKHKIAKGVHSMGLSDGRASLLECGTSPEAAIH